MIQAERRQTGRSAEGSGKGELNKRNKDKDKDGKQKEPVRVTKETSPDSQPMSRNSSDRKKVGEEERKSGNC